MNRRKLLCSILMVTLTIAAMSLMLAPQTQMGTQAIEAAAIQQGDRGDTVKSIQQKLKQWGYYDGAVDGVYGAQTRAAVIKFQKKNGLTADGIVGTATARAMGVSITAASTTYTPSRGDNRGDLTLLAKLVHGEARGEVYMGKVAVAAVVLNRVKSPLFPNTITGVIYQPGAFTCVSDGQFQLSPSAESIAAARDAMNGWDPSQGALYYYNPKKTTNSWIYSRPVHITIGAHRFAK